jgi:hypothetical protein
MECAPGEAMRATEVYPIARESSRSRPGVAAYARRKPFNFGQFAHVLADLVGSVGGLQFESKVVRHLGEICDIDYVHMSFGFAMASRSRSGQ